MLFISSHSAIASVVINGTRVIYNSDMKFVPVQLINQSDKTHLVQSWIDKGDMSSSPENIKVPFTLTPPVVKINGHNGQTLKITSLATDTIPKDRESVFWLNVLDVPPTPEGSSESYIQVAIRNRIKLIYRPAQIKALDSKTIDNISISLIGDKKCLKNNSPHFITIVELINWSGGELRQHRINNLLKNTLFIPPFECIEISKDIKPNGKYRLTWLDDFGAKRFSIFRNINS